MPFDMAPTVETQKHLLFRRLRVLRELIPKTGDQGSWGTCAWSAVRFNEDLRRLGVQGMTQSPSEEDHLLFGPNAAFYFGGSTIGPKVVQLDEDIAELERELVTV